MEKINTFVLINKECIDLVRNPNVAIYLYILGGQSYKCTFNISKKHGYYVEDIVEQRYKI